MSRSVASAQDPKFEVVRIGNSYYRPACISILAHTCNIHLVTSWNQETHWLIDLSKAF